MRFVHFSIACCLLSLACSRATGENRPSAGTAGEAGGSDSFRPSDPPRGVIDSALPLEEEIRRFREAVPETPFRLTGGERSRDVLVRRWVRAIETRDSVALREMVMTAAEFITFYYPESPYTHPPYRQSPALRWFLISSTSSQGATRVWQRHAGRPLGYAGYSCNPEPEQIGSNRIWTACALRLKTPTSETTLRLFGPIIERAGWFKFLNYGSDY